MSVAKLTGDVEEVAVEMAVEGVAEVGVGSRGLEREKAQSTVVGMWKGRGRPWDCSPRTGEQQPLGRRDALMEGRADAAVADAGIRVVLRIGEGSLIEVVGWVLLMVEEIGVEG